MDKVRMASRGQKERIIQLLLRDKVPFTPAQALIDECTPKKVVPEPRQFAPVPFTTINPSLEQMRMWYPGKCDNPALLTHRPRPIEDCEIVFEYVNMGKVTDESRVFNKMNTLQVRPASFEELICFDLTFPDEQEKHEIVALGSLGFEDGQYFVSQIYNDGIIGRAFEFIPRRMKFPAQTQFLAVREMKHLREGEFVLLVDDNMPTDRATLEKEFPRGVSPLFYDRRGSLPVWNEVPYEGQMPKAVPATLICKMMRFNKKTWSGSAREMMLKEGYRPATRLEAYAYFKKFPDLQGLGMVAAVGSECEGEVAVLGADKPTLSNTYIPYLSTYPANNTWSEEQPFLAVRLPAS